MEAYFLLLASPEAAEEESSDISETDFVASSAEPSIEYQNRRTKSDVKLGAALGASLLLLQRE